MLFPVRGVPGESNRQERGKQGRKGMEREVFPEEAFQIQALQQVGLSSERDLGRETPRGLSDPRPMFQTKL